MSNFSEDEPIDYKDLRKSIQEVNKKGSFPFPSYAEALFSQVLISLKPIKGVWDKPKPKVPLVTQGPRVAGSEPQNENERKQVLQSLGRFVEEQSETKGSVTFPGGEAKIKAEAGIDKINLDELNIKSEQEGDYPLFVEALSQQTKVLFLGDRPKDFDPEAPHSDLLSKMIAAMKLSENTYCRVFIEKDQELGTAQWHQVLNKLDKHKEIIVVCLGAVATNIILGKKERLSRVHGKEVSLLVQNKGNETTIKAFPIFHPDILQINPNMKRSAWLDLQKVMEALS